MVNCTIDRLHQSFKMKYNKLDSNHKIDLPPAFIDDLLFEAALDYVDIFYTGVNTQYQLGFEVNQQRIDMLNSLIVPVEYIDNFTELPLPEDYMHLARVEITSPCGNISFKEVQLDDIDSYLSDSFKKPSKAWKRALGYISRGTSTEKSIYLKSEGDLTKVTVYYIKCPQKGFIGGYDTLEYINGDVNYPNKNTSKINLDIPCIYQDIVVDIAVQNMSGNLRDYNHTQYLQNKTNSTT